MIVFPGYEESIQRVYENKQDQVFAHWQQLDDTQRKKLLTDLTAVNFEQCAAQFSEASSNTAVEVQGFGPADFIRRPGRGGDAAAFKQARDTGLAHLRAGKLCAFVVAGGQGSRLGYDGPKGAFQISPVRNKSLFQIHTEKLLKYSRKYGVELPFFIMTSQANHEATVEHFKQHAWFGMNPDNIRFFPQNMIPSLDTAGKLVLDGPDSLFRNLDGHGGSLTALQSSGALAEMKKRGIETISYFQVDNPTVAIIDPEFIGFHLQGAAEVSTKVLTKAFAEEKVGNLVRFDDGRTGVVEYSDLSPELACSTNSDGSLRFQAGSIGIHLFQRDFVERLGGSSQFALPFHVARKKIKAWTPEGTSEIDAFKFEKFVFDALPLASATVSLEVLREDEFAPVKNRDGLDSIESSRQLMMDQHRRWLNERGIEIPPTVRTIEISPLLAVEAADLPAELRIPAEANIYLD